jgi:hypothetical protein
MDSEHHRLAGQWGRRAQLAWDTIAMKPARGVATWMFHTMDIPFIEQETGRKAGDFKRDPDGVYLALQDKAGCCFIDQYIPTNVLTMGQHGFESSTQRSATTGADQIVRDGMVIDSPEAAAEHMERVLMPQRTAEIAALRQGNADEQVRKLIERESSVQARFGPEILKGPYDGFGCFPHLHYGRYGYADYFMAYALYPELMERDFAQQADLAVLRNTLSARAIIEGGLPRLVRLDHDMVDSRGPLVSLKSLERIWWPHFARSIKPLLEAGVRLIWHCDGNQMPVIPMLLEAGIGGFQGFQYEDGMDYVAICRMKDRRGGPLFIVGGVSVTRTLPFGSPSDVRDQLKWLVENGPPAGLMLGPSSSIVPGVPHENLRAFMEGLNYYRLHGRG